MMYPGSRPLVQIKKYPNRRFYDATNSRHVTLQDVHDMILSGVDVVITDSRTDEDLTNLVLTQLILEQDEPKLSLLPSSVLHFIIRSNRQVLRQWFDNVFGPFTALLTSSQRQLDSFLRQAMNVSSPLNWAEFFRGFMQAQAPPRHPQTSPPIERPAEEAPPNQQAEIQKLREQLAAIEQRLNELNRSGSKETG